MLCALTVRRVKPGTLEEFKKAFVPGEETEVPAGIFEVLEERSLD
jgi:hypothetical protein